MSEPLSTTTLFAFREPVVKPGELVVPVLLQGGEWAHLSAPSNVWRKLIADVATALNKPTHGPSGRSLRYNKAPR